MFVPHIDYLAWLDYWHTDAPVTVCEDLGLYVFNGHVCRHVSYSTISLVLFSEVFTCIIIVVCCLYNAHRLGLLSDSPTPLSGSPIDTLCAHLQERLQYRPGERDAIFMRETFTIEWPNKTKVSKPSPQT